MEEKPSYLYLKVFLILVLVAATLSIIYKSITLYKNSSFRNDTFNLLYVGDKSFIAHIDSRQKRVVVIKIANTKTLKQTRFSNSALSGVLIDGQIMDSSNFAKADEFINLPTLLNLVFQADKSKFNNINEFDLAKMFLISKITHKDNRHTVAGMEKVSAGMLFDKKILNEQSSVAVINASEISGLGAKVSNALKKVGYNVVSVEGSDKQKSKIMTNISNASVEKLAGVLKIPVKRSNSQVFDIIVVVGEDILNH